MAPVAEDAALSGSSGVGESSAAGSMLERVLAEGMTLGASAVSMADVDDTQQRVIGGLAAVYSSMIEYVDAEL